MAKRVTKKLVATALSTYTGWNFAYDFKESQRITVTSWATDKEIIVALRSHGVTVVEHKPASYEQARTGSMKLEPSHHN